MPTLIAGTVAATCSLFKCLTPSVFRSLCEDRTENEENNFTGIAAFHNTFADNGLKQSTSRGIQEEAVAKTKKKAKSVKDTAGRISQEDLVKALNHPIRVQALTILTDRVASPTEISNEIGVPLSHVSYHVRVLDELGMIEIVEEEPVRGAVKHYYKAVQRPYLDTAEMEELSPHVRTGFAAHTFETLIKDASNAMSTGTFDARPELHFSRTPLLLDEEGFKRVAAIQNEALEAILEEQAASAERRSASGEEGFPAVAAMFSFEMPKKQAS